MSQVDVPSPCISVCVLNEKDVCVGCYRSASEITDWFIADDEARREILARAGERRAADNPIRLT